MYVEERMYLLHLGKAPKYLKHCEEHGMRVQLKYLPYLVGYCVSETGPQNLLIHLWRYDSLDQREKCREAMRADPDWQAYLLKVRPLTISQDARILKCAPFFVERLKKMLAAVQ